MRLAATSLDKMDVIATEVGGNRRIVLQDKDGRDMAAIIPIEDLYLLEKLDECINLLKPHSRFPDSVRKQSPR